MYDNSHYKEMWLQQVTPEKKQCGSSTYIAINIIGYILFI